MSNLYPLTKTTTLRGRTCLRPLAIGIALTLAFVKSAQATAIEIENDGRSKLTIPLNAFSVVDRNSVFLVLRSKASRDLLDLSALTSVNGGAIEVNLAEAPISAGEYSGELLLDAPGSAPRSVSQFKLLVRAGSGSDVSPYAFKFSPTLELGVKSQAFERTQNGAPRSSRPRYADATLQGGFESSVIGNEWELLGRMQFAGSSVRTEATTYSYDGGSASKVNVQDYLFDAGWRDTRASLGSVSVNLNPALASNISNRGVAFAHRLPYGLEISAAAQSTATNAGFDNFTGLSKSGSQTRTVNLGYDLVSTNPGHTRVDVSFFDGAKPNPIPSLSEEKSRGFGGRLMWRNASSTFRTELTLAHSEQQVGVPQGGIKKEQGYAYTAEAGYDLLKDKELWGSRLAITAAARMEYSSPLFRSLGSNFLSNYQTTSQLLSFALGGAQIQLQGIQRFDNVDADRTYIRNRVQARLVNLNFPADMIASVWRSWMSASVVSTEEKGAIVSAKTTSKWVPAFSLSHNFYDAFGDRGFVPEGYSETDLPRLVSSNSALGFNWRFDELSFGWKGTLTRERNRQVGEEKNGSRNLRHGVNADYNLTKNVSLSASYDLGASSRLDELNQARARVSSARASWKINDKNDLSLELNQSRDFDTFNTKSTTNRRAQLQWNTRFEAPLLGLLKPTPIRAYARGLMSENYNWSAGVSPVAPRVWMLQIGFTTSVLP
jgi:hypothetical protein